MQWEKNEIKFIDIGVIYARQISANRIEIALFSKLKTYPEEALLDLRCSYQECVISGGEEEGIVSVLQDARQQHSLAGRLANKLSVGVS